MVAPSANLSNHYSAVTAQQVQSHFPQANLRILDGGQCTLVIESTPLKINAENDCQILRYGVICTEEIVRCIGFMATLPKIIEKKEDFFSKTIYDFSDIKQLPRHLTTSAVIITLEDFHLSLKNHTSLEMPKDLQQMQWLYSLLANAEKMPQKTIFIYLASDFPVVLKQQIIKFAKPIIEFSDN